MLGGQHAVKVAKDLRAETLARGLTPPAWQISAVCSCLRHDTPLEIRQAEAGNNQFRQGLVVGLPLSATAMMYHQEIQDHPERGEKNNMSIAIQKTGQKRSQNVVCFGLLQGFSLHALIN